MDNPTTVFPNSPYKFECKTCDFNTCNKKDWKRHIVTKKHITNTDICPNTPKQTFICNCGKIYKHSSSLCLHKKTCTFILKLPDNELIDNSSTNNDLSGKELIMMLINENKEFKQIIIEQNKTILEITKNATTPTNNNTTNNNITNTNSHNKTFNLQFFLNEQCKDALNITEFVSSIKMQITDLETTGRRGYVEGVSRIINKNLKELDMFKRPIHCSDLKRETLYIKNDNEWKKENDDKPLLTRAIKQVANENIRQIGEWKKEHPDCTDSTSRQNDLYLKIVSNAMSGGTSEEQSKNYEKIISNIAKEVVIDK